MSNDKHGSKPEESDGKIPLKRLVSQPLEFRAWYKGEVLDDVRIDMDGSLYPLDGMGEYRIDIDCTDIYISQYTGVSAKDGKKIFSGDIVYWPHIDDLECDGEVVMWNQKDNCFVCDKRNGEPGSWLDDGCLIKGNVFKG